MRARLEKISSGLIIKRVSRQPLSNKSFVFRLQQLKRFPCLLLDFKRVLSINESACRFLHRLLLKVSARKKSLVLVHAQTIPLLRKYMKRKLDRDFDALYLHFEDVDRALEWCEDRLIVAFVPGWKADHAVGQAEYELFRGMSADEIQVVAACLEPQTFSAGEAIIRTGDEASELYFLARGTVSVLVLSPGVSRVPPSCATVLPSWLMR